MTGTFPRMVDAILMHFHVSPPWACLCVRWFCAGRTSALPIRCSGSSVKARLILRRVSVARSKPDFRYTSVFGFGGFHVLVAGSTEVSEIMELGLRKRRQRLVSTPVLAVGCEKVPGYFLAPREWGQ